jgi:hypothetical protein
MDSSRRDRKRAHDREAQRINRARTRAYISQLESTIAELSHVSGAERPTVWQAQLTQQQDEIQQLKKTLNKITKLAQGVDGRRSLSVFSQHISPVRMSFKI